MCRISELVFVCAELFVAFEAILFDHPSGFKQIGFLGFGDGHDFIRRKMSVVFGQEQVHFLGGGSYFRVLIMLFGKFIKIRALGRKSNLKNDLEGWPTTKKDVF